MKDKTMQEIVIKIPEEDYNSIKSQVAEGITNPLKICIANGIVLPKGHGDLIDVSEYFNKEFGDAREFLDKAERIIEADRSENEDSD